MGPNYNPELCQFPTPPALARRIVAEWPQAFRGKKVLEPSAGEGNLVEAALQGGAKVVDAVEIDPAWCEHLRERFKGRPVRVHECDFLELGASSFRADTILQNPPFDDGKDTSHLEAVVARASQVISVLNSTALHGSAHYDRVWRRLCEHRGLPRLTIAERRLVRRPRYLGAGGQRDAVVVRFGRRIPGEQPLAWWPEVWG